MSDRHVVVGMRDLRADIGRAADALERIASWLESVQLVDPLGEPDPEETLSPARLQAEEMWANATEGQVFRMFYDDGHESTLRATAERGPLRPEIVRIVPIGREA